MSPKKTCRYGELFKITNHFWNGNKKYYFTCIRLVMTKNINKNRTRNINEEEPYLFCAFLVGMGDGIIAMEKYMGVSQCFRTATTASRNSIPRHILKRLDTKISKRDLHTHANYDIIHNPQMFLDR